MSSRSPDGVFYLTTPIYYINGPPASRPRVHDDRGRHDGPLPPARRGRRLLPDGHRRARGQDRPGGRARRASRPQALADRNSRAFRDQWGALGITYDDFIRTTEPRHARVVQAVLQGSLRAGRDLLRQVRRAVLLRVRALLHREGDRRRQVSRPPDAADATSRRRTTSSGCRRTRTGSGATSRSIRTWSSPSATGTSSWASCGSRSRTCRSAARRAGSSGASRSRSTTGS